MAYASRLKSYPRGVGQKGEKKENVMKRQILAMIALGAVIGAPLMAMKKAPIDLSEPPLARRQRLAREAAALKSATPAPAQRTPKAEEPVKPEPVQRPAAQRPARQMPARAERVRAKAEAFRGNSSQAAKGKGLLMITGSQEPEVPAQEEQEPMKAKPAVQPNLHPDFSANPEVAPRQVLGVAADASAADIKREYKALALLFHPDHFLDNKDVLAQFYGITTAQQAQDAFAKISAAFAVLRPKPAESTN